MNHISIGSDFQAQTLNEHEFGVPPENQKDSTRTDTHFGQTTQDNNNIELNRIVHQRSIGVFFIDKLDISKKLLCYFECEI